MEKAMIMQNHSTIRCTHTLTVAAVLAAGSFILAFFEFPIPFSPTFARMDLSDLPALVGAFAYGPLMGVLIELIKNLLQLPTTSTGAVGELANFLVGSSFVGIAGLLYRHHRTRKAACLSCLAASVGMGIVAAAVNYFLLLPIFEEFMPLEQLIASFRQYIPFIQTKLDIVLFNALPFNLLKGLGISFVTRSIYQRLEPILRSR